MGEATLPELFPREANEMIVYPIFNEPVLVTGCARSGTSLVAGILNLCGAYIGGTSGPTRYNKKGQFENGEIRKNIVKPYIKGMGYDPMCQNPLPDINKLALFDMRSRVLDAMVNQEYEGGHWMYKCPKMCLIWPVWNEAFPGAKWIIVRRDTDDIIDSCLNTQFMRAYRDRKGWRKWVDVHVERFHEMKNVGLDVHEIWSWKVVAGDYREIREAVIDCGLEWNESAVRDFVSPELYHSKREVNHG